MERWCASAVLALVILVVSGSGAQPGSRSSYAADAFLVRFHAEGAHALEACAEARSRSGQPFVGATADRSDSLDRLHQQLGVRSLRALFRSSRGGSFAAQRQALRRRLAGTGAAPDSVPDLSHVYRVRLAEGSDVERAVALYGADAHVAWAQPDYRVDLDFVPDDPFFGSSDSWDQGLRDLWGLDRIRASEAWDRSLGEGVVVAVVDTGIDYDHPDLADNVWVNPGEDLDGNGRVDPEDSNGIDDDENGFIDDLYGFDFANSVDANEDGDYTDAEDVNDADPFDDNGHGTHVAGTIAAVGHNGLGVIGVAPGARIMGLKGFSASGPTTIAMLARAMVYAIEHGAQVINNSWSCSRRCPSNPVAEEAVRLAHARNVVVVTSAGNRRDDVSFYSPEKLRETIVVGATTPDDAQAGFTNTGLRVDVVAPGSGSERGSGFFPTRAILSLLSSGAGPAADGFGAFVVGEHYLRWVGTSMSSPHVAGLAALIRARYPGLDVEGVRARLRASAEDLGAPGHDAIFGAGRIDAARALDITPPDLYASFTSPEQGAIVTTLEGALVVRGSVEGADLARWSLAVGTAPSPATWEPLVSDAAGPVLDDVLLRWDASDRPPGAYALRLRAEAWDGRRVDEFLMLSLEHTAPREISFSDGDALAPRVSGDRVVWESERLGGVDDDGRLLGLDLYLADFHTGLGGPLVRLPGHQRSAALDGSRVVWIDSREHSHDLYGCEIEPGHGECRAEPVFLGEGTRESLETAAGRVAWVEIVPGQGLKLRACEGEIGEECEELPLSLVGTQADPFLDGDLLIWTQRSPTGQLVTCDLSEGGCDARPVIGVNAVLGPVMDAGVLAGSTPIGGVSLVFACVLDPDSHVCAPNLLGVAGPSAEVSISRDRLVWHGQGDGGSDIFLCEFDRRTHACPVQRLTGSMANERNPQIDGDRVVWEDDRRGLFQVYALELPRLQPIPDTRVRRGRPVKVRVRGSDPSGEALALSASLADGGAIEAIGMRFRDLGKGKGQLFWRADGEGPVDVTFTGAAVGGIQTRRTVRIEVEP